MAAGPPRSRPRLVSTPSRPSPHLDGAMRAGRQLSHHAGDGRLREIVSHFADSCLPARSSEMNACSKPLTWLSVIRPGSRMSARQRFWCWARNSTHPQRSRQARAFGTSRGAQRWLGSSTAAPSQAVIRPEVTRANASARSFNQSPTVTRGASRGWWQIRSMPLRQRSLMSWSVCRPIDPRRLTPCAGGLAIVGTDERAGGSLHSH